MNWANISQTGVVIFKLYSMKLPQETFQGK